MAIRVAHIGKTKDKYLEASIEHYLKRISKHLILQWIELPEVKRKSNFKADDFKKAEAELILNQIKPNTYVIGLDEKGPSYTSVEFSKKLNNWMVNHSDVLIITGGAYGYDNSVYNRMNEQLSLSKMTLSHQMVRLLAVEQIYRGISILKGEPYHNE